MENVTDLQTDGEEFRWYLRFRCTNCGDESRKWIYVSQDRTVPITGSRGEANLAIKCKLCSKESSVDILPETISKYTIEDSNKFKSIVTFDCRGVFIIDFSPRDGFQCRGIDGGTEFENIDFEEKEWFDYDEKKNRTVGIYKYKQQFLVIK